jgi:hypothetical protein
VFIIYLFDLPSKPPARYLIDQQRQSDEKPENALLINKYIHQARSTHHMMLNKIPANTTLQSILNYLDTSAKWGARNRALFAVRQQLRIKDIAVMTVSSVVNLDASVRRFVVASDGIRFDLSATTQAELKRYIQNRFDIKSLEELTPEQAASPLFITQKKPHFSANTLAQHFSYLDRSIHERFQAIGSGRSAQIYPVNTQPAPSQKSTLSRLMSSLAGAGTR